MRDIDLKRMENQNRIIEVYPASRPTQMATLFEKRGIKYKLIYLKIIADNFTNSFNSHQQKSI